MSFCLSFIENGDKEDTEGDILFCIITFYLLQEGVLDIPHSWGTVLAGSSASR